MSITTKMTKEELVNTLVILMDVPKAAEGAFRSGLIKLPVKSLEIQYDCWVRAMERCNLAEKNRVFAEEHLKVAERRNKSLENSLKRAEGKK